MAQNTCVDIVLSVYNGENYLRELLQSLQAQSHKYWRLWIRDDGSSDRSLDIIHSFIEADARFCFSNSQEQKQRLGVIQSFSALLSALPQDCKFFMLCDQDDVWHPEKIQTLLNIYELEPDNVKESPYLSFSDLALIDSKGAYLGPSHFRFLEFHTPQSLRMEELCAQNIVVGCSVFGNSKLLRLALPISTDALMHDWWLALIAKLYGTLRYVPLSLVDYRQHEKNASGGSQKKSFWNAVLHFRSFSFVDLMEKRFLQLMALKKHLHTKSLTSDELNKILEIAQISPVQRIIRAYELAFLPRGLERQVFFLILLALLPQRLVTKLSET